MVEAEFWVFTIMSSQKRKRIDFSLKQKLEIIDVSKNEPNQTKLAHEMSKKWGIYVKRTLDLSFSANVN